ncbi:MULTISPECIES: LysR family transcriptional regulator [unclassified Janthinobacterium]|uniref:LysR family transcriptional regulator n=1 Tax=unclassified Janthinobacterium TaxID=2610881 RepID=UPI00160E1449|nr:MULTISPECIES: LysR family transcriptional regulator [unclassified Janthinobacterium]MBB5370253.1 DNA-binding transcriptional LysR family regulator [Janthinobacterium sp. K2C7]MBB5383059.1 DNA-binding transcriptional LysR family regulator [Janthinobacterium sp. K2Li3]MBB5388462.1 DNA-binding transcriptional LysR family regulator [Janthinobacterium sp. K2E3]
MATDRLGDMRLFAEAAALGSLSAAGRKLALSPAAASARLFKLEAALHTRLFDRSTRQLRLTEEGRLYLQHCLIALRAIDEAEAVLQEGKNGVRGKLRISASADFGRHLLNQWLEEFISQHPDLKIALTLSDSMSNLLQDDIDLAIRFGRPQDGSLIARPLAPNWRVLCAAPDYLARHGEPSSPEELAGHQFIVLVTAAGPLNTFHFAQGEQQWSHTVTMEQAWETNDGALARSWALAGHGIARKTIWDAAADIRAGKLKILLPGFSASEAGVHAVFHSSKYMAPRVRLLLDFLIARFAHATEELLSDIAMPGR